MAIIGIDLGTTNSLASVLDDSGNAKIIHNSEGSNLTPSVVWIQDNKKKLLKVGAEAKSLRQQEQNVYFEFKRVIGTSTRYPFFDSDISPTELSAFVLQKLKNDIEKNCGKITECVISVPTNFKNEQREATLAAAKIAGINTEKLINEPTAAALYYVLSDNDHGDGTYLVFDFGGGTFDATALKVKGEKVDVLSSEGLQKCGGADLDEIILNLVKEKFKEETKDDLDLDKSNFTIEDAEAIKISLTTLDEKKISIMSEGYPKLNITITRKEFEAKLSSYLMKMQDTCEAALDAAKLKVQDVKAVFLAGGSSRIPAVQIMLENYFGKKPVMKGNPDEAIALGACLYAGLKTNKTNLNPNQNKKIENVSLQEIAPANFGTIIFNSGENKEENFTIIKKNTNIPCSVTESVYTLVDNQTKLNLTITQSAVEETDPRFVRIIWKNDLELPDGRPKGQEIKITYSYQENGLMNASFEDVASGKKQEVDITAQSEGTQTDIDINDFIVE